MHHIGDGGGAAVTFFNLDAPPLDDQRVRAAEGTDAHANLEGYISITPLRADLTAHDLIDDLKAVLE